jgi:hypothetical protein
MIGADGSHHGAYRPHRRVDLSRSSDRAAVVALSVAALLALLIWSPNLGGHDPGDPAAVTGDARVARCGGSAADLEYAIAVPHARDSAQYLPSLAGLTGFGLDRPGLVLVYRPDVPVAAASAGPSTAAPQDPDSRTVCIYVGTAAQGDVYRFGNVSIAGLRASPNGPALVPGPAT